MKNIDKAGPGKPMERTAHAVRELPRKVFSSRFVTISIFLHFILVLLFGGTVLFNRMTPVPDFDGGIEPSEVAVATQRSEELKPVTPSFTPNASAPLAKPPGDLTAITAEEGTRDLLFRFPDRIPPLGGALARQPHGVPSLDAPATAMQAPMLTMADMKKIADFTKNWSTDQGLGHSVQNREFEFTAFLAKYGDPRNRERGGDWAATHTIKDGKLIGGSLPNLLYVMNKLSRDKIHANPNPVPLDLSSQEIFAKNPPFIFFTGHRDFVLTPQEVENLQKYIRLGGCIWGDSSLPGLRSRFDVAFRREMRRVIPDADKSWEPLPPTHPLFTKNLYYPEIRRPTPGINFYQEPVYALKYAGEIAVLYTANDYGDMWQIGLDSKGEIDLSRDERGQFVALNGAIWDRRAAFFRNVEAGPVLDAYKFGTNVVIHLLTRWEDRVRAVPKGL